MVYCLYCKEPVDDNASDGFQHDVCVQERNRRSNAGLCIRCGEVPSAYDSWWCVECENDSSRLFKGYPPWVL